jgi:pimeloyl-ACP methyl ester carboxylesterase
MATFVLIPGAGGVAWYFSRLLPLLEQAGHRAVAVDLPGDDESAGLSEYADPAATACAGATDVVLVAQSLGGFTAPLVCERVPVRALVFVNAMIPVPGETPDDWGDSVGSNAARIAAAQQRGYPTEFDLFTYFLHDVDPAVAAEGEPYQRPEAQVVFENPCAFEAWPDVPVHVLAGADDRLFPADFQRRVARERLGVEADVRPGGHLIALSNAPAVAEYLLALAT